MAFRGREGGYQTRIARGEQEAAERTDDIEGFGVRALPDVIENDQRGAVSEQFAKPLLSGQLVVEQTIIAELVREPALDVSHARRFTERNPEYSVFEAATHFRMTGQRSGEHTFANAAHTVQANTRRRPGDNDRHVEVLQKQIP